MHTITEKRKYPRLKLENFKIKYRISKENASPFIADVLNISSKGICFIRNVEIKRDLNIDILFPFRTKKVIIKARILRVEGREVGAKFVDNEENMEKFLNTFNMEYKEIRPSNFKIVNTKKEKFSNNNNYSESRRKFDNKTMLDL